MKIIITFTFCCVTDWVWKSKFMAVEKPGKLFFSYFVATLTKVDVHVIWYCMV